MKLGVLLLSKNNVYIGEDGNLPTRPRFDKTLITDIIKGQRVLCSIKTLRSLPPSILEAGYFTTDPTKDYDINFGISTLKEAPVDMLMIIRSTDTLDGTEFRLDNYELIFKPTKSFELYRRIK